MLLDGTELETSAPLTAFRMEMHALGWSEGHDLESTIRLGEGRVDRIRAFATEVVKNKPDVIVANGGTGLTALLRETRTIPIVFGWTGDPVSTGLVASMAHPGGNATGFTAFEASIATKWLELLKELAPSLKHLMILNPGNPNSTVLLPAIEKVVRSLALEMTSATVAEVVDIEHAIDLTARQNDAGMIVLPGSFTNSQSDVIVALAARYRIPAVYGGRIPVSSGGLMSYGAEPADLLRQAAGYVSRVLHGEKPADLPVQAATRFELVINLKTAKALGLTVPPTLLATADEVIE
jgi:putative ABC transport system substrate-binding protein